MVISTGTGAEVAVGTGEGEGVEAGSAGGKRQT